MVCSSSAHLYVSSRGTTSFTAWCLHKFTSLHTEYFVFHVCLRLDAHAQNTGWLIASCRVMLGSKYIGFAVPIHGFSAERNTSVALSTGKLCYNSKSRTLHCSGKTTVVSVRLGFTRPCCIGDLAWLEEPGPSKQHLKRYKEYVLTFRWCSYVLSWCIL